MSIVINIQNTTIFEPVILTSFYTSLEIKTQLNASNLDNVVNSSCEYISAKHDLNN